MELILNLVWVVAALLLGISTVARPARTGRCLGARLVSVAALLVLLFPVISVSDDLQLSQILAESDTGVRRAQLPQSAHADLTSCMAMLATEIWQSTPWGVCSGRVLQANPGIPQKRLGIAYASRPPPSA